jgi:hypothetical protein
MLPRYLKVPEQNIHFLNMPFYETGKLLCARLRGMIQYATSLHIRVCCGLLWPTRTVLNAIYPNMTILCILCAPPLRLRLGT